MKRRHLLLAALSLVLSICMCFCLSACSSCGGDPVALATPVVTVDVNGVAKWDAVENASGYAYKISDGEEQTTDKTSVSLTDGQSIVVKAVGDGENYSDSGYSEAKTYSKPAPKPSKLDKPVVTVSDAGVASWTAVGNASGYKYSLDDGANWSDATGTSVTLTDGQKIVVKAIGNGTTYLDSDPSEPKTYTKPAPQPSKLGKPEVTISDTGVASWTADEHADGFKYSTDSGANWSNLITTTSTQLTDGQTVIVKAVGNGTTYLDSDPSDAKTYNASTTPTPQPTKLGTPVVTISDTGLASWVAVPNATKYMVKIGENETEQTGLSKQLENGQTIQVKAVGDGTNYSTGDYCAVQTYTASTPTPQPEKLGKPEVTLNGAVASWTAIANASGYKYSLDAGATWLDATGTSVTLTSGQTVTVKAVSDSADYTESDPSTPVTYTAGTVDPDPPTPPVPAANEVQFVFKEVVTKASTTAYTADKAKIAFDSACKSNSAYFSAITATSYVYPGNAIQNALEAPENIGLIKFGSSSKNGTITLTFKRNVTKVVITAKTFVGTKTDTSKLTVNGVSSDPLTSEVATYTFEIDASNTVTISSDSTKTGMTARCFVYSITLTTATPTLEKPVVTINEYGLATWEAVEGAGSYTYSINGGEAQPLDGANLSVQLADEDTIVVTAVSNSADYKNSVSELKTFNLETTTLEAPTVTISKAGVASWNAIPHATAYVYKIGENGTEVTINVTDPDKTKYTLSDVTFNVGDTIYVKTKGDIGAIKVYLDSIGWKSDTYSTDPEPLHAPAISIARNGTVTITPSEENNEDDVEGIVYYIGADVTDAALAALQDSAWTPFVAGTPIKIETSGHGIAVKTLTNDTTGKVLDSAPAALTYTAPSEFTTAPAINSVEVEGTKVGVVNVTFTKNGASSYEYVIDGTAKEITATSETDSVTFEANLADGKSIIVRAVGNRSNEVAENGNYSDRYNDKDSAAFAFNIVNEGVTYNVVQLVAIANFYGATTDNKPATKKIFTVSGTVFENSAYNSKYKNIDITLYDETSSLTFVAFRADFESNVGSTTAAKDELVGTTVTATGIPFIFEDTEVNPHTFTPEFQSGGKITAIVWDNNEERFDLAKAALSVTEDYDKDEVVSLQTSLPYGVTVTWDIEYLDESDTTAKAAIVLNKEEHTLTLIRQIATDDSAAILKATLHYNNETSIKTFAITVQAKAAAEPIETAPVVTIDNNGKATWEAVEHADKYAYQIVSNVSEFDENAAGTETTDCFVTGLVLGQIIYVKAVGDGTNYTYSAWSTPVTYKIIKTTSTTFDFPEIYKTVTSGSVNIKDKSNTSKAVTVVFSTSSGTNPAYYANGTAVRVYANNTITVSVDAQSERNIKKITFGWSSGSITMSVAQGNGKYADKVWTGSQKNVTFTVSAASDSRIKTISVDYDATDAEAANDALTVALSKLKDNYSANFELDNKANDLNVTWMSSDENVVKFTKETEKTKAEVTTPANGETEVTITAKVSLNGSDYQDTKKIKIKPAGSSGDPTTQETWKLLTADLFATLTADGKTLANKQIILTTQDGKTALGKQSSGANNCPGVSCDMTVDKPEPGNTVYIITLENGAANTYNLKVDGGYLYAVKGQNHLKTAESVPTENNSAYNWTISFNDDAFKISATIETEVRYIQKNNKSSMFSGYKNTQTDIVAYIYA